MTNRLLVHLACAVGATSTASLISSPCRRKTGAKVTRMKFVDPDTMEDWTLTTSTSSPSYCWDEAIRCIVA
jgi:hypothetical protein